MLWIISLVLYSALILSQQILRRQPPLLLYIPYLIFIPGYAFTKAAIPQIPKLEKLTVSLALSLALLVGFKSLIQTFRLGTLLSEITIAAIIAIICLVLVLIKQSIK